MDAINNLLIVPHWLYKSLATSVYNYDTDNAIKKFEKYKTEGAMMKAKYQNKEITSEEFIKWIFYSKSQETRNG